MRKVILSDLKKKTEKSYFTENQHTMRKIVLLKRNVQWWTLFSWKWTGKDKSCLTENNMQFDLKVMLLKINTTRKVILMKSNI